MPVIGEIRKAREIGYKSALGRGKFIWIACPDCGKERWVLLRKKRQPQNEMCRSCWQKGQKSISYGRLGANALRWAGGRVKVGKSGYILVFITPDSPYWPMATYRENHHGYVLEHRLVMAQHLGRCLGSNEWVHHIDGNKQNNDISNLRLVTGKTHPLDYASAYRDGYRVGLIRGYKIRQRREINER